MDGPAALARFDYDAWGRTVTKRRVSGAAAPSTLKPIGPHIVCGERTMFTVRIEHVFIIAILCLALGILVICLPLRRPWVGCQPEQDLVRLWDELELGMSRIEVSCIVHHHENPHLQIIGTYKAPIWAIRTPLLFSADNWWLFLLFSNNSLAATAFRYEDTSQAWPSDAPEDLVQEGFVLPENLHIKWQY